MGIFIGGLFTRFSKPEGDSDQGRDNLSSNPEERVDVMAREKLENNGEAPLLDSDKKKKKPAKRKNKVKKLNLTKGIVFKRKLKPGEAVDISNFGDELEDSYPQPEEELSAKKVPFGLSGISTEQERNLTMMSSEDGDVSDSVSILTGDLEPMVDPEVCEPTTQVIATQPADRPLTRITHADSLVEVYEQLKAPMPLNVMLEQSDVELGRLLGVDHGKYGPPSSIVPAQEKPISGRRHIFDVQKELEEENKLHKKFNESQNASCGSALKRIFKNTLC